MLWRSFTCSYTERGARLVKQPLANLTTFTGQIAMDTTPRCMIEAQQVHLAKAMHKASRHFVSLSLCLSLRPATTREVHPYGWR